MILSGSDVRQYMKFGGLSFSPGLNEDQYQQNGIDLILADADMKVPMAGGSFTLGVTREAVKMPNDLMAFVQLRSTWARRGFMIPPTVIDAGFEGTITLEIGTFTVNRAPIGERFAHVIFAKLSTPSEPYSGKYQHQSGIVGARPDR